MTNSILGRGKILISVWFQQMFIRDYLRFFFSMLSELEVEHREVKGNLWHIKYPIEGDKDKFLVVATTRPETM